MPAFRAGRNRAFVGNFIRGLNNLDKIPEKIAVFREFDFFSGFLFKFLRGVKIACVSQQTLSPCFRFRVLRFPQESFCFFEGMKRHIESVIFGRQGKIRFYAARMGQGGTRYIVFAENFRQRCGVSGALFR